MKRAFLVFLIFSSTMIQSLGQGAWTLSLGYMPRIEHRSPNIKNLFYYPVSPALIMDYRITNRFSLSTGLLFHYEMKDDYSYGVPGWYSTFKNYIFEIPLQVNYHLLKQQNKIDPYIKTSTRYTHYDLFLTRESVEEIVKSHSSDHDFLWDIGAGINLKIHENFFFRLQLSYGLGIKPEYRNLRYLEPMISFGYKLHNK